MIDHLTTLNNGVEIPSLGLGTYKITDPSIARKAFEHAIELGYRHFDTASLYQNEHLLGEVVRASGIARSEFFITTKLWNDDQGYDSTLKAFDISNSALGLDYVDLYLIHWPVKKYRLESWRALEKLYEAKALKAIGVSNYMSHHLIELLDNCNMPPAVNQIELSPYNYKSRSEVKAICDSQDIKLMAYCPLTRGLKLEDERLVEIALKYGKSAAQVLIKWGLQRGIIEIPKSGNLERITQNAEVFDFKLSNSDLDTIDQFDENLAVSWDPTKAD